MEQEPAQLSALSNTNKCLERITPEMLIASHKIFSHHLLHDNNQPTSIGQCIKTFARLRRICTHFSALFNPITVGKFCSTYNEQIKTNALYTVIDAIDNNKDHYTYRAKRLYALILVYAGADVQGKNNTLLRIAVRENDTEFVDVLLKHGANPYTRTRFGPIFWCARTTEMAQLFIDNQIDIQFINRWGNELSWNVLKHIITNDEYSKDLLELYLTHKVDATLCDLYNSCLLHTIARIFNYSHIEHPTHFLDKAKLLLAAIPAMINVVNKSKQTPLETAQEYLKTIESNSTNYKNYFQNTTDYNTCKELIALYKKHGGLTTETLNMILLLHNDNDLGDLSLLPRDVRKDIVQYMNVLSKQAQ